MIFLNFFCLLSSILWTLFLVYLSTFQMARALINIIKYSMNSLILKIKNQSAFTILGSHRHQLWDNQVVHLGLQRKKYNLTLLNLWSVTDIITLKENRSKELVQVFMIIYFLNYFNMLLSYYPASRFYRLFQKIHFLFEDRKQGA